MQNMQCLKFYRERGVLETFACWWSVNFNVFDNGISISFTRLLSWQSSISQAQPQQQVISMLALLGVYSYKQTTISQLDHCTTQAYKG